MGNIRNMITLNWEHPFPRVLGYKRRSDNTEVDVMTELECSILNYHSMEMMMKKSSRGFISFLLHQAFFLPHKAWSLYLTSSVHANMWGWPVGPRALTPNILLSKRLVNDDWTHVEIGGRKSSPLDYLFPNRRDFIPFEVKVLGLLFV